MGPMYTLAAAAALCLHAGGGAGQLVTVDAASARSTTAIVRVYRREGRCWHAVAGPWPAHVGRNGLSRHHREGDGSTPLGTFRIGSVAYGVAIRERGSCITRSPAATGGTRTRPHRPTTGS